ncbi:fluoride efflux transporter CrcB [Paenilisteria rocourtiae]|uniref:Fluoride-specific ion channel FluC n=2 Tax=Listeria rocourtiae TaxID=647910 RepID=A0A4R6ZL93_9LIST|nr:fluoride efflux transporter CrcB [Listeria rocourtiae]MBC1434991.1 fluoride efflux transporter CrcB [Listeria rocourtiae]MBC1604806.1 fluoride efflux transporter CrcB [Listeria rocourtiae]TDR53108.1 camphor resistance protein CrcB [Listeria rocourtiae]
MKRFLMIGVAGMTGALCRYFVGLGMGLFWGADFPLGTLLVNWSGCLILGFCTTYLFRLTILNTDLVLAIGTGFLGAYTTFSTFSLEVVQLFESGEVIFAVTYLGLSFLGGNLLAWIGFALGERRFVRKREAVRGGDL